MITNMKKIYMIALMAVMALTASAQQAVNLSSYSGTNVDRYDGTECNVTFNRVYFTGWNTISVPFSMSENELNEVFGTDCKLEKLVDVAGEGNTLTLTFQDCKASGVQANIPYILYYTGEIQNRKVAKTATLFAAPSELTFIAKGTGETVQMVGAQSRTEGKGLYGVLAKDNSDAKFVSVDDVENGFYATRCFVKVSSGNSAQLITRHIAAGEVSRISDVVSGNEIVDVYSISGVKVASGVNAARIAQLPAGIYVVNGQKIAVK